MFGSSLCFKSIAARRMSVGQKTAPTSAWPVKPKRAKLATTAASERAATSTAIRPVGKSSRRGGRSTAGVSEAGSGWAAGSDTGIVGTLISL